MSRCPPPDALLRTQGRCNESIYAASELREPRAATAPHNGHVLQKSAGHGLRVTAVVFQIFRRSDPTNILFIYFAHISIEPDRTRHVAPRQNPGPPTVTTAAHATTVAGTSFAYILFIAKPKHNGEETH